MQGRKIKHKETGEVFIFLQFEASSKTLDDNKQVVSLAVIVEDKNGNICIFSANDVQFVKEEPIKTETTGIDMMKHKAESMPTLQNSIEVWACMDRSGFVNIAAKKNFYKNNEIWSSHDELFMSTNIEDFIQAFQGLSWNDEGPKKFRISVEPLG
jgi:hypothetical protein